jgi:hypothetical protein
VLYKPNYIYISLNFSCSSFLKKAMALVVATPPPELVVQTKARKPSDLSNLEERPSFCDRFWACMLNDYLEDVVDDEVCDVTEDDAREEESERVETIKKKTRKIKKKKKKHRSKSVKGAKKESSADTSLGAKKENSADTSSTFLCDDPPEQDSTRDRERPESDEQATETIDLPLVERPRESSKYIRLGQDNAPEEETSTDLKPWTATTRTTGLEASKHDVISSRRESRLESKSKSRSRSKSKSRSQKALAPSVAPVGVPPSEEINRSVEKVFHYAPLTHDLGPESAHPIPVDDAEARLDGKAKKRHDTAGIPDLAEIQAHSSRSMVAHPEEGVPRIQPSFESMVVQPSEELAIAGDQTTRKPNDNRRPSKDYEDKSKRRMPIDPDEDKSVRSTRSLKSTKSRAPPRPETPLATQDPEDAIGEGTPEHYIALPSRNRPEPLSEPSRSPSGQRAQAPTLPAQGEKLTHKERSKRSPHDKKTRERVRRDPAMNEEEALEWMLQESKKADTDYRRRKLERRDALNRIRAIKARLQTGDP